MADISDVQAVVEGLTGSSGSLVIVALILTGCYLLFKQTFGIFIQKAIEQSDFFVKNITDQLKNISEELKKTREAIITINQQQIRFSERLDRVECDVKLISKER